MRTAIIGVGNPLCGDDGLGVHLAQNPPPGFPSDVEIIDGGTGGLDLLRFFEKYDRLIILDTVRHGGEPGDVIRFAAGEQGDSRLCRSLSVHGVDLRFVLRLSNSIGYHAQVVVVGCEPLSCGLGVGLSEPVLKAVPRVWEEVRRELRMTSEECVNG